MPHEFHVDIEWLGGVVGKARLGETGAVWFALPEEFGGVRGYFKPEELLLSSLAACFCVVAWRALQKQRVEISDFAVKSRLIMDRDAEGRNVLTEAHIDVKIKAKKKEDEEKILRALELAEKYCPIGRALSVSLKITYSKEIAYDER